MGEDGGWNFGAWSLNSLEVILHVLVATPTSVIQSAWVLCASLVRKAGLTQYTMCVPENERLRPLIWSAVAISCSVISILGVV
jgi:hypothetical protein